MSTIVIDNRESLLRKGWSILVEQLGIHNATQFVLLLERGEGDSIEEIQAYWANDSIDDIYSRVTTWANQQ